MRPGQSCPGVAIATEWLPPVTTFASMRPGQSCPGVGGHRRPSRKHSRRGFNEAGAIMPRSGWPFISAFEMSSPASMRPGQSCPGVAVDPEPPPGLGERASMRPGQSCPGVAITPAGCTDRQARASMRPGQSCPGVVIVARPATTLKIARFNEAGAIMPRSGPGGKCPGGQWPGGLQ